MTDRIICKSSDLESGGIGVCFNVQDSSSSRPAFVIRHNGTVFSYLNVCAHLFMELDWETGDFFDVDGEYLICSNHGALFKPDTGECINGPCYGQSLTKLSIGERDGYVYLEDQRYELEQD